MNTRAILTLNDKINPLIQDFNFNGINFNEVKIRSGIFSLPPLYTHFINRTEDLARISADGSLADPTTISFKGTDADIFLKRFLNDLERFLNIFTISAGEMDAIDKEVTKVFEAKKTLVSKIATALNTLIDINPASESAALTLAIEALKQYLVINITNAYLLNSLLQFEVSQQSNNQSNKYVNFFLKTDRYAFQGSTKRTLTLVQNPHTYQPAVAVSPEIFLKNDGLGYQIAVPTPLNALPKAPYVLKQEAVQTFADGIQAVNELTVWDYNLAFTVPETAQDEVIVNLQLDAIQHNDPVYPAEFKKDLFSALAQYEYVANELWLILDSPVDDSKTPSPIYINAVTLFASLTENIVNNWSVRSIARSPAVSSDKSEELKRRFIIRSILNESGQLSSIYLSRIIDNSEPAIGWPQLSIQNKSGSFTPLEAEKLTEHKTLFMVPEEISNPQFIQLSWVALPYENATNAHAELKVIRNRELISGINTNPAFVLNSDVVNTHPISPAFRFDSPIDITKPDSDFSVELQAFFTKLFGLAANSKLTSIELSYLQPSSIDTEGGAGPLIQTPVALLKLVNLSSTTAIEITRSAQQWLDAQQPSTEAAFWALSLKVYDKNDSDEKVLLFINQLIYRLSE